MTHLFAESDKLRFSEVNRIARNVPTREIARVIASNKQLQSVVVDEALDVEKKRSVYDAIRGNENIQKLTFNDVNPFVVGDDLHRLCQMKSVPEVYFNFIAVTEPMALFHPTRNLCGLHVIGGNMGDLAAQAVGRLLRFRSCLHWITFCKCGLSNNGIVSVGHFLQQQSKLKRVYIMGDNMDLRDRAAEVFARGIEMNTSIESFRIYFPRIAENAGKPIFQALRANATLKDASITLRSGLGLGREEAVEAAHLLAENTTLTSFFLDCNSEHVGLITDALAVNQSLNEFRCSWADTNVIGCVCDALLRNGRIEKFGILYSPARANRITRDLITPICRFLASNSALRFLKLSTCTIEDDGYVALGGALRRNESLETLILSASGQDVTDRGVRALLDGVKVHPALKKVVISPLSNPSYQDEIDFYMERNTRAKPILDADVPLGIWPLVFKRANDCRHVGDRLVAPNMLYFFVKEKCELFGRAPSSRKRKRTSEA